ncbi:ATP-dependent DNA helicase chl1 [Neocucurbitaria cava]|uniref:ATP-dependent DNA helicase CHL1 n=1 Tax=Neocucurbitaria cava TaxID=798079 RepID=A0A9W8YE52_9PLEO|nr:ATP-dependent DNA helicase chl1 [Neocucurbitaria cava]
MVNSLTWLRDHKRRTFEEVFSVGAEDSNEPAWMLEHVQQQKRQEALRRKQEFNDRIAKIKAKEKRTKERYENGVPRFKRQKVAPGDANEDGDEAQFALDDYESDVESNKRAATGTFDESGFSAETQALMEKLGFSIGAPKEEVEAADETKIFFCSRTHSQLTQFSSELGRVKMRMAITPDDSADKTDENNLVEDVKYLTLGSRKNLCINDKVKRLGNATAINERCLELQSSTSTESRCPHMPTKESETLINEFRDYALAKIRDIEDLGSLGKKMGLCPYYASRPATKYCEVSDPSRPFIIYLLMF